MAFESLSEVYEIILDDFPVEWLPLTYLYDPDLPLYPIVYFHFIDPKLPHDHRPGDRDRLFGYIHHLNIEGEHLKVSVIINKDLSLSQNIKYVDGLVSVVRCRLGLQNPVMLDDIKDKLHDSLSGTNSLIEELWYKVIDGSFGKSLPFGEMWDPVLGFGRYVASWYSGGRKGEFIQTHGYASEFGVKIQTGSDIHSDFYLLPTFQELTDTSNPLNLFPKFEILIQTANEFVEKFCDQIDSAGNKFSAFIKSKAGIVGQLNTAGILNIIQQISQSNQSTLFAAFSNFNRGPPRTVIFLMMLHDLRHKLWEPSLLTPSACGEMYTDLQGSYQTPKVIQLYSQQCFGSEAVLPIDSWVKAFVSAPFGFVATSNRKYYKELFECCDVWGKLERLIWIAAQARKVHSSVCAEILWCVRYGEPSSDGGRLRGANPLSCKICESHIRNVCSSYKAIENNNVEFNIAEITDDRNFVVRTSGANNEDRGQSILESESKYCRDIYSTRDRPEKFNRFPVHDHDGSPITVNEFITKY